MNASNYSKMLLRGAYEISGSWRVVADLLGQGSAGAWCAIAKGSRKLTPANENSVRRFFGYAPRRCRRIEQMRTDDLAWYVRTRRSYP